MYYWPSHGTQTQCRKLSLDPSLRRGAQPLRKKAQKSCDWGHKFQVNVEWAGQLEVGCSGEMMGFVSLFLGGGGWGSEGETKSSRYSLPDTSQHKYHKEDKSQQSPLFMQNLWQTASNSESFQICIAPPQYALPTPSPATGFCLGSSSWFALIL